MVEQPASSSAGARDEGGITPHGGELIGGEAVLPGARGVEGDEGVERIERVEGRWVVVERDTALCSAQRRGPV